MQKSKLQFKIKNYLPIIPLIFILTLIAAPASAAQFFFGAPAKEVAEGSTFAVGVFVDSQGQDVNAFEGNIVFPSEHLALKSVEDSNSIVSLWLKRPEVNVFNQDNKVFFSGIIPGGYTGTKGYLFSLVFAAQKTGEAAITSSDDKILLNDGLGTSAEIRQSPLALIVSDTVLRQDYMQPLDGELPETFTPLVSRDPNLFDNKWFLVFATQDKGSGIDHYEVAERKEFGIWNLTAGRQGLEFSKIFRKILKFIPDSYKIANSPYLLKDQELRSNIYVKAIDKDGNERISMVLAINPMKWYENYWFWLIIVLVIAIIFWLKSKLPKNKK